MPKIGIVGSLVWDRIYGWDPLAPAVEEWGGIAYALAGLDAGLPSDWEIVPLIKVGRDLGTEARELLRTVGHLAPGTRCVEVTAPNNRVVLHYQSAERRTERMAGGVPGWTWGELGPMVRDLDAIYVNFISGFELTLGTAQALRQGFKGPIYADLHSLFLGMQHDGSRILRPLPDAAEWFGCFDMVQLNEDEMRQLSPDPLTLSAQALHAGVRLLIVTLGPRGAVYVTSPGPGRAVQSALVPAPTTEAADPTGCGDVFGATACAKLVSGSAIDDALRQANAAAARNAGYRGATGLARHLRGELVTP